VETPEAREFPSPTRLMPFPPREPFVPAKVVQHRYFHRDGGRGRSGEPENSEEQFERQQLYRGAKQSNQAKSAEPPHHRVSSR